MNPKVFTSIIYSLHILLEDNPSETSVGIFPPTVLFYNDWLMGIYHFGKSNAISSTTPA